MSILLIGPVLLVITVAVTVSGVGRLRDRAAGSGGSTPQWQPILITRVLGLIGGALSGAALVWLDRDSAFHGRAMMLAPAVFGLVVVVFVAVGEIVVRTPAPPGPRTASLATRRVLNYVPKRLIIAVSASLAVLAALLIFTTYTASSAGYLAGSRQLAYRAGDLAAAVGPYPGSYYSIPLALVMSAMLILAALSAHRAVRRPRGRAAVDCDLLRRHSVSVIMAASGLASCLSLAGIALQAAFAWRGISSVAGAWALWVAVLLVAVAALALGAAFWFVIHLLRRDRLSQP